VIQYAWLPVLRVKLISKSLHIAVNTYMESLIGPLPPCNEAAAKIQKAAECFRFKCECSRMEERKMSGDNFSTSTGVARAVGCRLACFAYASSVSSLSTNMDVAIQTETPDPLMLILFRKSQ
jgi:hypothetical protein